MTHEGENMQTSLSLSLPAMLLLFAVSTGVSARDTRATFPIAEALQGGTGHEKMDSGIALYFGNQKHPKPLQTLGERRTNKKTNGFGTSDKAACERAFIDAALELQKRARKEGGNAVIGIKSNYKDIEETSETNYTCGSGALMSGVALKGTVVKLAK